MALFLDSIIDKKPVMLSYYLGKQISQVLDFVASAKLGAYFDFVKKYDWVQPVKEREEGGVKSFFDYRNPGYNAATMRSFTYISYYITNVFKGTINKPEKFLWHEDLVPPHIFHAMGLVPFLVEAVPIILPNVNNEVTEHYIDVCENAGYPGDICTLPKTSIGMVLEDQLPPPRAIVTSNSPCDGGMASYAVMEEKYKVPVFRLDLPYWFTGQRGLDYYLREIRLMIEWLEDIYSVKMDYGRLREVCEEHNRAWMCSMDLWDLQRVSPAPLGGETLVYSHLAYPLGGGTKAATRLMKDILRIARRTMERDGGGIPNERHRVILWNPPPLVFPELFAWMEREYGAITVMDMLTYKAHPFIDTSTTETMLRDLAYIMAFGPMAQHTRGPYENFFGDLFHIYESFNADMIMMAAHTGCKNTRALLGIFKEQCRRKGIPLLIFDYDLSDSRVVSPAGIKRQVADFMENIMGERKSS